MSQPSIRDIAKAAGVSPTTVFRALDPNASVKDSTRRRILEARNLLQEGNAFSPAESVIPGSSIGIVMPASTAQDIGRHPSMFVTMSSFISALSAVHASNTLLVYDENTMKPEDILSSGKDGYMITGTNLRQEELLIPALSKAGVPCILINRLSSLPHTASVNVDDKTAVADATRHLISLGHTRIAFLGGSKNYQHTRRRLQGYQTAMNEAGLPIPDEQVLFGHYSESSGFEMGETILSLRDRPTSAVCASDTIALGCIRCLMGNGLSIPGDFSLIGFGDIESGRCFTPPLSTITQASVEVGEIAAKMLLQMVANPIIMNQQITLQTHLALRGTTTVPPVR